MQKGSFKLSHWLTLLFLSLVVSNAKAQLVTTLIGGSVGDGGPAVQAQLRGPSAVAFDASGVLYIADGYDNRIRKVDSSGIISTFAGIGQMQSDGCAYALGQPNSLAIDKDDNVFVAERGGVCILKITPGGQQSIIAGNGFVGLSPDGAVAAGSPIAGAISVAVDGQGTVFFLDLDSVRTIDESGLLRTVLAVGNFHGTASGLAVGSDGAIYVGASSDHVVLKRDAMGQVSTIAGVAGLAGFAGDGGPATSALLSYPSDIHIDVAGNIYIADAFNNDIRRVDSFGMISTIAGDGSFGSSPDGTLAVASSLAGPDAVTVDNGGTVYFADGAAVVRKISSDQRLLTVAGGAAYPTGTPAVDASLSFPMGIATDSIGDVFVADQSNNRVRKIDTWGRTSVVAGNGSLTAFGDEGLAVLAGVAAPTAVAVDARNGDVYIGGTTIRRVDSAGIIHTFAGAGADACNAEVGTVASVSFGSIDSLYVDKFGNLFVADAACSVIRRIDVKGTVTRVAGTGVSGFSGDGGAANEAALARPRAVIVDEQGNIFIADTFNERIRRVDTGGFVTTIAGDGESGFFGDGGASVNARLCVPAALALDKEGTLYIADQENTRVRAIASDGTIATVAGDGFYGFYGDGGPAVSAYFSTMVGLAEFGGNLYISDLLNQRVRRVTFDRIFMGAFE